MNWDVSYVPDWIFKGIGCIQRNQQIIQKVKIISSFGAKLTQAHCPL